MKWFNQVLYGTRLVGYRCWVCGTVEYCALSTFKRHHGFEKCTTDQQTAHEDFAESEGELEQAERDPAAERPLQRR